MAGDWIKMRADLLTHPKIVRISSALKADKYKTIGVLFSVWAIFDAHSEDGRMEGYSPEVLDAVTGQPGIATAMHAVGWLQYEPETSDPSQVQTLVIPRFSTHNGKSAKRRALDTERKRTDREAQENHVECPEFVRIESGQTADTERTKTGLEKRREEYKRSPLPPKGELEPLAFASPEFAQAWDDWETSRRQARKPITPKARSLQMKKLAGWGEARAISALVHSAENGYQGLFLPREQQPGPAWRNGPPQKEAPPSRRILNHPEPAWPWKETMIAIYGDGNIPEWSTLDQLTQEEILAARKGDTAT